MEILEELIPTLNNVEARRLRPFMLRILQNLPRQEPPFTEEEVDKLQQVLETDVAGVKKLIANIQTFFKKLVFLQPKPSDLASLLSTPVTSSASGEQVLLSDDRQELIARLWLELGAGTVSQELRTATCTAPNELVSTDWRLSVVLSHSGSAHVKQALATLDLGVKDHRKEGTIEHHNIEFTHQELYEFFQQLETIQNQLDELTG